ncbi:hypothetical protein HQ865_20905 [Mucilaginibacter mali]|uniref:Uncharacterized protein n=1 Tax=Mucilaginibacter mali TaxID=2740462 RepID=A0A7D4UEV2_9SPHI|nr:hypothetical protein [Mucilaginibacter mali]QKJ32119.1 hypothetical protein HQ865_20905 [Mucilaginibacter mali]
MKKNILTIATLLVSFSAAQAWYAGIDGKWTAMLKGPDGNEFPISYTFKASDTTLTGTLTSSIGTFNLTDGTIKGDSIWFTADLKNMQIKNKGRFYANGDSISLRVGAKATHTTLKRVVEK